jgi:hypothetical protein
VVGMMFASGVYLAWAGIGRLLTGHSGLFFLDPALMGDVKGATIAASFAFISLTPGSELVSDHVSAETCMLTWWVRSFLLHVRPDCNERKHDCNL